MTNSKELFNLLVKRISLREEKSEIQSIIYLLLEKKLGFSKTEILSAKETEPIEPIVFDPIIAAINAHTPIQYILGEAEFYGRTFMVNPSVLIPRPETELLVNEIRHDFLKHTTVAKHILDIGTGSGCLAITLSLEFPHAIVCATDISKRALITARKNAETLLAQVQFFEHNILTDQMLPGPFDLIVSNPPYILEDEKAQMKENVLAYEPPLALFAAAKDPLAFYRAIAAKCKPVLSSSGEVWVEINERFGNEVASIFLEHGYHSVRVIKDLDNKDRMVTATC